MPHFAYPALSDELLNQPAQPNTDELPTPALPDSTPAQPELPAVPVQRCPAGYREGVVENGQSFSDLLLLYNVSYDAMRSANPSLSTRSPQPGSRYCAPPSGSRRLCTAGARTYVMEQGETLTSLTLRFETSAAELLQANPSLAPGDFLPGRVICLP